MNTSCDLLFILTTLYIPRTIKIPYINTGPTINIVRETIIPKLPEENNDNNESTPDETKVVPTPDCSEFGVRSAIIPLMGVFNKSISAIQKIPVIDTTHNMDNTLDIT